MAVARGRRAVRALLCCWIAFAFARDLWGECEGRWAAGLLGFFLIFDFPSSVIPLAADLLMLAPHEAASLDGVEPAAVVGGRARGRGVRGESQGAAGAGGLRILGWPLLLLTGFATVTAIASAWMWGAGALPGYWDEVWRWGRVYAGTTFVENPLLNGAQRTLNWAGFHVAAVAGAVLGWRHADDKRRLWIPWLAISRARRRAPIAAIFSTLLFPDAARCRLVLLAARGFALAQRKHVYLLAALLVIPLVRFGPHYYTAVRGAEWRDTAMDRDSRSVAATLRGAAHAGDTLFVWGYRPEIYAYSHLPASSRFLDSQPLTGVPADRHLTQSVPVETEEARARRAELARTQPEFIVDGLGAYNPHLALGAFEDLRAWMGHYRELARSGQSVIYQRVP